MSAIVLDVETTGLVPEQDRVIELAIVDLSSGAQLFHSLFHPGRPIPPGITAINGIRDEDVMSAHLFKDQAHRIMSIIADQDAVIGHNVFFDKNMIHAELSRCDLAMEWPHLICTKRLWNHYESKDRRLMDAYKRFVKHDGFDQAHSAIADTNACREVFLAQLKHFGLEGLDWEELIGDQSSWWGPSDHIVWDNGFLRINFGKNKGTHVHLLDRGYMRWIVAQDFPDHVKKICDYMMHIAKMSITPEDLASWARHQGL